MANSSPIQQLYVAFFQRPADPAGLAYWTSMLNSGASLASIAQAFAGSAEFAATIAGKPTGDIIDGLFQGLFGRPVDPAGLQYWRPILAQNGLSSMAGIVLSVLNGAQGLDQQALDNRVAVADQFTTTVNGNATYNSAQDIANARDFLKGVTTFTGTMPTQAQITSFIQNKIADPGDKLYTSVAPPAPVAQTFTLTAGADTIVAGDADDTIIGTVAGSFANGDSINGGGGNDTLTVTDASNIIALTTKVVNVETVSLTSSSTINVNTNSNGNVWTGLKSLSLTGTGNILATAGAHTLSITEAGAGQTNNNIIVSGGTDVTVSTIHNLGAISIGAVTEPTGTVNVNSSTDAGSIGGTILVKGGTTVTVTQTATNAVGSNVTAGSAVTVNGTALTTAVTVTQPTAVEGAAAVVGVNGVAAVSAVTGAPGTQAVAAVTGVNAVTAVTGRVGFMANGIVNIKDASYNSASANTITTVALSNYGATSSISTNKLTSLSLAGTAGTLALNNATNGSGGVPTANSTLALTLNGLSGTNTVTDTNNEITTLNVTTTGADSSLAAFADTGLTTLNVAGSKTLTLGAINSSLTKIAVSGDAGFNDGATTAATGFAARGAAAVFTTTSSGPISLSLDATTQAFAGSTGVDTLRISSAALPTKAIAGGSSSSDELILEGTTSDAIGNHDDLTGLLTGFETLGVAANVTGNVNVANLGSTYSGLHTLGNSNVTLAGVSSATTLTMDTVSTSVTARLNGNGAGGAAASESFKVVLGGASTDSVNFGTLVLNHTGDSNLGVGTVSLVSNGLDITPGDAVANNNTLVLTDNGLSTLNFSGTQGLAITTINQTFNQAASITLNNTNTGSFGLVVGTLTDSALGTLTFSGTGATTITTLTDASTSAVTLANTGSKLATVGTFTSSAVLTNLTLTGNVQIGDGLVGGTGLTSTATTGITVSGATDNAHVKLSLGAAAVTKTNAVTLGNGNNVVTDATTAGTANVTVGTGSNFLTIGGATTNTTGVFNITLGTHSAATGSDHITVGTGGTSYAAAANYTITGVAIGDRIIFNTDLAATLIGHTAGVITPVPSGVDLAATITALEAALVGFAHKVAYATYGTDTYVVESISGTPGAADTTLVKITGLHQLSAGTTGGNDGFVTVIS